MKFAINKTLFAASLVTLTLSGAAHAGGDVGQPCCPFSDETLKNSVQPVTNATQKVLQLRGVEFKWNDSGRDDVGVIAQNVNEVFPQLVHKKQGLMTVDYDKLVAPLIESVRELNARIEVLEKAKAQ
ncbi:tail fiber domain-containing protein [Pseudomonas sp. RP23018S]|uniref:tail fiber domain-containing protein n=1 Tax=Pseudomonas sp. RP23018S TaxID=3096037 RepID=UPI002ACA0324|nr:tail fiber domain-containing protein [Pseudomonas sp. RP23018S]MDZ5605072.1 tail fiber domain-containing protein [Pseudomonas sp. RP23018S]